MSSGVFQFENWIGEAKKYFRADLIGGLTLWALVVPESVGYADLAHAPTPAAGLYGLIIILPIYALFASSRYLVASSTAAASATLAGFLGVLHGKSPDTFTLIVMATALAYLVFYFLKLGFISDFISEPVSRGFLFGLGAFIIIGQSPKLFGFSEAKGDSFVELYHTVSELRGANWYVFGLGVLTFAIIEISKRISERLPGGLIAMVVMIVIFRFVPEASTWNVKMVGALPTGFPGIHIPTVEIRDIPKVVIAAFGLVILGTSESSVVAIQLAIKNNQRVNFNQQFLAFGLSNLAGSMFGAHLSSGSASATMVNHEGGSKTLASTVWASIGSLFTLMFLTGIFAYVPKVFLAVIIIHALLHLLDITGIMEVKAYSRGEFCLSLVAALSVLLFGVLDGLILTMLLNILYLLAITAKARAGLFGVAKSSGHVVLPLGLDHSDVVDPPAHVVVIGNLDGMIYYASARRFAEQIETIVDDHPSAKKLVFSMARIADLDFTSFEAMKTIARLIHSRGMMLYLTDVFNPKLQDQLEKAHFDGAAVHVSTHLDVSKL